jgi:hypothetical protein
MLSHDPDGPAVTTRFRDLDRLVVVIGGDALNGCVVDRTSLELREQRRQVRDVVKHHPFQIGARAEETLVRHKGDVIAWHALAPAERSGADRRVIERGRVGIICLREDVLRHDEGPGQDRHVWRVAFLHPPGDLGRADDLDVGDLLVAVAAVGAEMRVVDKFQRVLHVVGGEWRAVMPDDIRAQFDAPIQTVLGDAAIADGGNLSRQLRNEIATAIDVPQWAEYVPMDALIHLDMWHQRVEYRRLLRQADNDLAGRFAGGGFGVPCAAAMRGCAAQVAPASPSASASRRDRPVLLPGVQIRLFM